jgi:hypothetical protein
MKISTALLTLLVALSTSAQYSPVTPRPLPSRGAPRAQLTSAYGLELLANPETGLIQYSFFKTADLVSPKLTLDPLLFANQETLDLYQANISRPAKQILTETEAQDIFNFLTHQNGIPYEYIRDNCFDRANAVSRLLEINGIESQKIFAHGIFIIDTPLSRTGMQRWTNHVAALIQIQNSQGTIETRVIDPTVSHELLSLSAWFTRLTKYTALGCANTDKLTEVYGVGQNGCTFEIRSRFNYGAKDFKRGLTTWNATDWASTVSLMNTYYQDQVRSLKLLKSP